VRYECIDRRRQHYPVQMMCRAARVSRSGYYAWRVRPDSARTKRDRKLVRVIRQVHAESDGTYGSRKVRKELRVAGFACGRRKVAKLMRSAGLKGCPVKRYRVRSGGPAGGSVARNLLQQDFSAIKINTRWACDMTYIWTSQGWLYLAVVMDLCSRRIVGWSMSRRINRHLALDALQMALAYRHPDGGLIHHSDRGAQYLSDDYQTLLKHHGIECSMSARGNCYDNAAVESFFSLLKRERIYRRHYRTRDEARTDVFDYIERFYNRQRRHGYLGDLSPVDYEKQTLRSL
jgi:putative transposase